ncbi:type II toxin-antitoxin system Phd/YefM family antitoxin [Shimia thalassica]|uniref:type II toxin-antitoxin system Phd/YefM family antitoxin n=1 Tax=Shimia thalassica TaxID=1715693 RepID=UPI00349FC943
MNLTISEARAHLGQLCTRAQDPRQPIILTRHGKPIAALVSMAEVQRIWEHEVKSLHCMLTIILAIFPCRLFWTTTLQTWDQV